MITQVDSDSSATSGDSSSDSDCESSSSGWHTPPRPQQPVGLISFLYFDQAPAASVDEVGPHIALLSVCLHEHRTLWGQAVTHVASSGICMDDVRCPDSLLSRCADYAYAQLCFAPQGAMTWPGLAWKSMLGLTLAFAVAFTMRALWMGKVGCFCRGWPQGSMYIWAVFRVRHGAYRRRRVRQKSFRTDTGTAAQFRRYSLYYCRCLQSGGCLLHHFIRSMRQHSLGSSSLIHSIASFHMLRQTLEVHCLCRCSASGLVGAARRDQVCSVHATTDKARGAQPTLTRHVIQDLQTGLAMKGYQVGLSHTVDPAEETVYPA